MAAVERLITTVDADDGDHVSVQARHEAVLTDGRRFLLLDDRGWGSTQPWITISAAEIEETTRVVVGPDEPSEGHTREEMAADHWDNLARILRGHGVAVDARELRQVRHDVVFSERLLGRIGS